MGDSQEMSEVEDGAMRDVLGRLDRIEASLATLVNDREAGLDKGQRSARRRFTLSDLMIIVAFSAVGMLPYRPRLAVLRDVNWPGGSVPNAMFAAWFFIRLTSPMAAAWSPVVAVARFIPPRPPVRRVLRQVGVLTSIGVVGAFLVVLPLKLLSYALYADLDGKTTVWISLFLAPGMAGFVAAGVRLSLWAVASRRPPGDWVDAAGQVLGWYWIAAALVGPVIG